MRACRRQLAHGGRSSQRGSKHEKRDSGTTVVKSVAIVLPEVFCYLKFSAGVVVRGPVCVLHDVPDRAIVQPRKGKGEESG